MNTNNDSSKIPGNRLRVFALFSKNAAAIQSLRKIGTGWGITYEIIGAFASDCESKGIAFFKTYDIPYECIDKNGYSTEIEGYFEHVAGIIDRYQPDLIILSDFQPTLPVSFIQRFPGKIIAAFPVETDIPDTSTGAYFPYTLEEGDFLEKAIRLSNTVKKKTYPITSGVYFLHEDGPNKDECLATFSSCLARPSDSVDNLAYRIRQLDHGPVLSRAINQIARNRKQ